MVILLALNDSEIRKKILDRINREDFGDKDFLRFIISRVKSINVRVIPNLPDRLPQLSIEELKQALCRKNQFMRELAAWLIVSEGYDDEIYELANNPDPFIRLLPIFSKDRRQWLKRMAKDKDPIVRYHVASICNSTYILRSLIHDNEEQIRHKLAERGFFTDKLCKDSSEKVALAAIRHASAKTLEELVTNANNKIKSEIASTTKYKSVLKILQRDPEPRIREVAYHREGCLIESACMGKSVDLLENTHRLLVPKLLRRSISHSGTKF